jgi:hypothetical protein
MTEKYIAELEKHIEELKDKYAHLETDYPRMVGEHEFYKSRSPQWVPVTGVNAYVYRLGKLDIAKIWSNPNRAFTWAFNIYANGNGGSDYRDLADAQRAAERLIFGGHIA